MKIIATATTEAEVLAVVGEQTNPEAIRESLLARAECCVDHLCGCE